MTAVDTAATEVTELAANHAAHTGTHSHAHAAMGSQGDDETHTHEHTHDGDARHDHAHGSASAASQAAACACGAPTGSCACAAASTNPALTAAVVLPSGEIPWEGVLVLEGIETGDERIIEPNALDWADLPLPLTDNHDRDRLLGRIDEITRTGTVITGRGVFDDSDEGREAARQVAVGLRRGLSIDMDNVDGEIVIEEPTDPSGNPVGPDDAVPEIVIPIGGDLFRVTSGRIRGAALCTIAAFVEAQIRLVTPGMDDAPPLVSPDTAVVAAAGPVDLADPPAWWFEDPHLERPTHLTVTDEGRVLGHIAAWGTCHTSFAGTCVTVPHSESGYRYFATGRVDALGADGAPVAARTGILTLGTGHADPRLGWRPAAEHYDNTGTGVADLAVGEDDHGIWVAGSLRPGVSAEAVRVLRASDVSGDWRRIGGEWELVGLLVVNVAGFPVPSSLAAAGAAMIDLGAVQVARVSGTRIGIVADEQVSLVAAGLVHDDPVGDALRVLARRLSALEAAVAPLRPLALETLAHRIQGGETAA